MSKNVHVVPSGTGWLVEIDGEAASHRYPNRREAIQVGRRLARANRGRVRPPWPRRSRQAAGQLPSRSGCLRTL